MDCAVIACSRALTLPYPRIWQKLTRLDGPGANIAKRGVKRSTTQEYLRRHGWTEIRVPADLRLRSGVFTSALIFLDGHAHYVGPDGEYPDELEGKIVLAAWRERPRWTY